MKYLGATLVLVLLSGCMVDVLTSAAIQGKLQADQASAAKNTLNRVTNDTGQMNLQRAVDLYHAEKAVYPPTLDLLVPNFIDAIPARADGGAFGYNPVSGRVLDDDRGPAPADYLMMEKIQGAINAYGNATGYFPPTLDTLTQAGYLAELPRTAAGESFDYNNQTGVFTHPQGSGYLAMPPRGSGRTAPAGGGGPLGEATTGIAIQEQLNRNSNAGTDAVGTRSRSGARDAAAQQTQRQEQALDALGF